MNPLSNKLFLARARVRVGVVGLLIACLSVTMLVTQTRRANADDVRMPWWWNGKVCDAGRDGSSRPLGASYLGVQVCGPQPYKFNGGSSFAMVAEGPDRAHVFGEGEWQCVELAMRFMALVYGVRPYGANGDNVVDNYSPLDGGGLVKYRNGTVGVAPLPGDVISFADSMSVGHVGVVTQSSVDSSGNGSITMISQNDTDDGWHTLAVTDWNVAGFTHHSATGWLHDPAGRGLGGATASADAGITARRGGGYWAVTPNGKVSGGGAPMFGDASRLALKTAVVDIAATPSGKGYWLLGGDGGIFTYGDAHFYGSTGNVKLNQPIIAMAPTVSGHGYWLLASDGGIFSFGDAHFHGSTGNIKLNRPVVGMAATPSGHGYWLTASDGGIFGFGDARFHGSTGNIALNQPVVDMAASPSGRGYWLVATDGGIFGFGDAMFLGSTGRLKLAHPIVGMARTPDGRGYWLVESDGLTVRALGDAKL